MGGKTNQVNQGGTIAETVEQKAEPHRTLILA